MNKKGQYYQPPQQYKPPFRGVSPILILGIIVFVVPFFGPVIKLTFPKWMNFVGIVIILIGVGHSLYLNAFE